VNGRPRKAGTVVTEHTLCAQIFRLGNGLGSMQTKLSGHHLNGQPNRARGMRVPLIGVCDPVTQLCLPPGAAQDVLRCYLPMTTSSAKTTPGHTSPL
jgi:hypothetical protein